MKSKSQLTNQQLVSKHHFDCHDKEDPSNKPPPYMG